jgi:hypothetical protein
MNAAASSDQPEANRSGLPEGTGPVRGDAGVPMAAEQVLPPQEATVLFFADAEAEAREVSEPGAVPQEGAVDPLIIGEYRVAARLGRGGMSAVYLGWHGDMRRRVALKLLRQPRAGVAVTNMLAEVQATARLQHPNVVQLYHVLEYDNRLCLVLEYVDGGTLSQRLAQEAALDFTAIARIMLALAQAVQYAHEAGVLHLDLKPGNVLLTADGRPKIADFGLARLQGFSDNPPELAGTPRYMAPEQTWAGGTLGVWTDVYGLGTILYQLLTGQPPVSGGSLAQVFEAVRSGAIVPIGQLNPQAPAGLVAICQKCLHLSPGDRYTSAAALAGDLQRFLAGEAVQVPVQEMAYRLRLWLRHPARMHDAALVMTLVSGAFILWCLLGLLLLATEVLEPPQYQSLLLHILTWLCGGYLPGLALGIFVSRHRLWAIWGSACLSGAGLLLMLGHLLGLVSSGYTMGGLVPDRSVLLVANLLVTCLFGLVFVMQLLALHAWYALYGRSAIRKIR